MDKSADSDTSTLDSADLEKSEMSPLTNDYDGDSGDHLLDIREDEAEDGAEVYRERISDPFSFQHPQPELFASSKVLSITKYRIWTTVWAAWHVIWLCLDPVFLHLQHLLPDKEWLFQLTHIVYIILTLHAILDCVASFKIKIYQSSVHLKILWFLYIITVATAPGITVCYFSLHRPVFQPNSMNFHIMNSVYAISTVVVSNKPLRGVHVLYPMIFVALYILMTSAYQASTGHALYGSFDWTKIFRTSLLSLVFVFILTPFTYVIMMGLTYARDNIQSMSDNFRFILYQKIILKFGCNKVT